jgi:hypothetical protein
MSEFSDRAKRISELFSEADIKAMKEKEEDLNAKTTERRC